MKLIRTEEAHPGLKVARDVTDLRGNLLFRAGTELSAELLDHLKQRRISHVFVEDAGSPDAPATVAPRKTAEEIAGELDRMFSGADADPVMAALREAAKRYLISRNK